MQERCLVDPLFADPEWSGSEKRYSPRVQVDSPVRLNVASSSLSSTPSICVRVLSASLYGLQLKVAFIVANAPVQIQVFNRLVSGEVRYCVSAGPDFRVGVRLHEGL